MPIQPTQGRVVYYYDVVKGQIVSHTALVTNVWTSDCLNLVVFPPAAGIVFKSSCMYTPLDLDQASTEEKATMIGKWGWMPYQKEQAKKTFD